MVTADDLRRGKYEEITRKHLVFCSWKLYPGKRQNIIKQSKMLSNSVKGLMMLPGHETLKSSRTTVGPLIVTVKRPIHGGKVTPYIQLMHCIRIRDLLNDF